MYKQILGGVALATSLLIVTSVFAAEAEPGDFLYQYKVQVNDRINGWFSVEYVADVDDQIDMIEDRLAEIDTLVASGSVTPAQAVKLKNNLISQIESATKIINNSDSVTLTATQVKQLKDGLDRMKDALARYSATLNTLDEIAAEAPEEKKRRGGSNKRTYDVIVDVVEAIEEEIVDAIDELETETTNDNTASSTNGTIDDTTSTSTNEVIDDNETTTDNTGATGDNTESSEDTTETAAEDTSSETTEETDDTTDSVDTSDESDDTPSTNEDETTN